MLDAVAGVESPRQGLVVFRLARGKRWVFVASFFKTTRLCTIPLVVVSETPIDVFARSEGEAGLRSAR